MLKRAPGCAPEYRWSHRALDAAECFHALAHPGEAAAGFNRAPLGVVCVFHLAPGAIPAKGKAGGGVCVPHDVGDRLAQRHGEHALLERGERRCIHGRLQFDTGGLQHFAGAAQLVVEPARAVPADRCPHLRQSLARDPLHVTDLLHGTLGLRAGELGCQLALQNNDGKRVAKQFVQVARDSFALGDFGKPLDLFLRSQQLLTEASALRVVDGDGAMRAPKNRALTQNSG
jgi:hypothetical protein